MFTVGDCGVNVNSNYPFHKCAILSICLINVTGNFSKISPHKNSGRESAFAINLSRREESSEMKNASKQ